MNKELKTAGFSLTEVLLAVGTFAIGMIFVAGVFPVAIRFTTIATERTIAAVVTDEAFAKIKLYSGVDTTWLSALPPTGCVDFNDIVVLDRDEFAYPSTSTLSEKHYYWSALCRRVDPNSQLVQVTVFVSRKIGSGTRYRDPLNPISSIVAYPKPVRVDILPTVNANELEILDVVPIDGIEKTFINDGYTIVDNETGDIYRVVERYADTPDTILLDRNWQGGDVAPPAGGWVWVVPPPIGGGRYPCVAIYQKVIRF